MISVNELKAIVDEGCSFLEKQSKVKEFEVFASANRMNVLRIVFASNVPNNALEEPKSLENFGLSVRALFDDKKIGFGKADAELSKKGIALAFEKAQKNAVLDNDFQSFAEPSRQKQKKPVFDKKIMELDEEKAIQLAYDCLGGAISELERKKISGHLNITGEIDFIAERMAVKNSNGINAADQGTMALVTLTTILEQHPDLSGMWFDSATELKKLDTVLAGKTSAQKALVMQSPQKIDSGEYSVVFGRVAVAELLYSRFDVGLNAIDLNASPYINRLDSMVASEKLSIADDGAFEGAIGTKTATDEGLPTGKTKIVEKGKLVNFLANDYYAKKFGGVRFSARNGFRTGGGGRHHDSRPGISATNLVVSKGEFSDEELLKEIKNGVYIGRIWYTYPVNGLASADFTSTVRGDSYIIENGKIKSALVPNTVRVNENLDRVFQNIIGISKKQQATLAWGQESVVITPEIAVKGVRLERIAKDIY